ncbi:MAG: hypothetical protein ACYTEZ_19660 [Planctomycetota bacterium]|jgi:mono/diheme cytochrome c family protein
MRRTHALPAVTLLGASMLIAPPATEGGGRNAGEIFQARCAGCHAVPDPALRTDRAWLDQVRRTA